MLYCCNENIVLLSAPKLKTCICYGTYQNNTQLSVDLAFVEATNKWAENYFLGMAEARQLIFVHFVAPMQMTSEQVVVIHMNDGILSCFQPHGSEGDGRNGK